MLPTICREITGPHLTDDELAGAVPAATDGAAGIGALADVLGLHIRLAHGASLRHFAETFGELDLTQKQVSVLWLVNDHPGIAQTDLAQRLQMDRATTMAIVNRLQARCFLRRAPSPADGRKQALFLEGTGEQVLVRAKQAVAEHEAWLRGRFTQREANQLLEMLARIHG